MNYLDKNSIYVLLVVFDTNSLNKSRMLDLYKIHGVNPFV